MTNGQLTVTYKGVDSDCILRALVEGVLSDLRFNTLECVASRPSITIKTCSEVEFKCLEREFGFMNQVTVLRARETVVH